MGEGFYDWYTENILGAPDSAKAATERDNWELTQPLLPGIEVTEASTGIYLADSF